MKSINQYIQEKFIINKNSKVLKEEYKKIINNSLGPWIFEKDIYKGVKNRRFEFLKNFDTLYDMIEYFGEYNFKSLAKYADMELSYFKDFIKKNNDELVLRLHDYYQETFKILPF